MSLAKKKWSLPFALLSDGPAPEGAATTHPPTTTSLGSLGKGPWETSRRLPRGYETDLLNQAQLALIALSLLLLLLLYIGVPHATQQTKWPWLDPMFHPCLVSHLEKRPHLSP